MAVILESIRDKIEIARYNGVEIDAIYLGYSAYMDIRRDSDSSLCLQYDGNTVKLFGYPVVIVGKGDHIGIGAKV